MGVLVALTVGLVFWLSAWAFGLKAFDGFMVTVGLVVIAVTVRAVAPFVRQLTRQERPEPGTPQPPG
jgi:uncharacterized membrane protein